MKSTLSILIAFFALISYIITTDACNGNGNKFIDEILAQTKSQLNSGVTIPSGSKSSLEYSDVQIWGLGSLSRAGDTCLEDQKNGTFLVKSSMQVLNVQGSMKVVYHWKKWVLHGSISGKVEARIPFVKVQIGLDIQTTKKTIVLKDFNLVSADATIAVHLDGVLAIADGIVSNVATDLFNEKLKPKLNDLLKGVLQTQLSKFKDFDMIKNIG